MLKGWAILGVIFFHMSFASRFGGGVMTSVVWLQHLFAWAAVAFFFCAGYLFAKSSGIMESAPGYVSKRAQRLLLPWLGLSLVYKILLAAGYHLHLVTTGIPVRAEGSIWHGFVQFMVWPGAPQLYFLPVLFAISVLCRLLCHAMRKEWMLWGVGISLVTAAGWLDSGEPHGEQIAHYPGYAAIYLIGVLVAKPAFLKPIQRRRLFFSAVALYFGVLCIARPTLIYLAVPLAMFPLQRFISGPLAELVTFLGRHAESIYAWHTPIVMPFLSITLVKCLSGAPWLLIPALTALTVGLSLGIARLVRFAGSTGDLVERARQIIEERREASWDSLIPASLNASYHSRPRAPAASRRETHYASPVLQRSRSTRRAQNRRSPVRASAH
jgi:hypothetical protein